MTRQTDSQPAVPYMRVELGDLEPPPAPRPRARLALIWLLAIAAVWVARARVDWPFYVEFLRQSGLPGWLFNFDVLLLYCGVAVLGAWLVVGKSGISIRDALCLGAGRAGWPLMSIAACAPMVVGGAILGVSAGLGFAEFPWPSAVRGVIRAPLAEEFLFRGLLIAVGALILTWHGVGFWLNLLAGAIAFGLTHITWSVDGLVTGWPNVLVTAFGGAWYAWLLARWRSLWLPIVLHAGMNLGWLLAGASGGAGGGDTTINILRLATIVIATVWTIRATRVRPVRRIPYADPALEG